LYEGNVPKAVRDTAYARAMERVHSALPKDDDAALLYALALMGQGPRDDATYLRAASIAEEVFERRPEHPGAAHYLIHALDNPSTAARGLRAARAYSTIAPEAAHALHMTSHIFVALGMWNDVVRANVQAQKAVGSRFGHYAYWLLYGLVQQGRATDAEQWIDSIVGDAPREQAIQGTPIRRIYTSVMAGSWVADTKSWNSKWARLRVDTTTLGFAAADNDFVIGLAALRRGERALADSVLARMRARQAAPSPPASQPFGSREMARVQEMSLRALMLHADGRADSAVRTLEEAARLEESQPFAFGPPATVKPPRELLGELLLDLGKPALAIPALEAALARTPRRTSVLLALARAHRVLGHEAESGKLYAELASIWANAEAQLPELGEVKSRAIAGRAQR
jgi:tetratricopeptide (TPR) repeat protein